MPPMTIKEIKDAIEQTERDLRRAERAYFLSMEEWANSDGLAEQEAMEECVHQLRWLEEELKYATGERSIEDDIPW